jgi:hypothetical protein
MSEPVTDPADYCKMTESWLLEKDRRGHDSQLAPSPVDEEPGSDGPPVALDEPYGLDDNYTAAPDQEPPLEGGEDYCDGDGVGEGAGYAPAGELTPSGVSDTAAVHDTGDEPPRPAPPRFNKRIAVGFVGATAAATVIAAGAMLALRSQPRTADADQLAPAPGRPSASAASAAPSTTATPDATDPPLAYTATAVGCLPGSTAAQSAAGADPTQAWVCVTGGNIGQYVRLNLGRTMIITAACVAPGWVGNDASGADQWHQHGVLTRVQWTFNDSPPTVVPKETDSVHGDVCQAMPNHGVLASTVLMLVQGVGRAPADTAPTSTPPGAVDGSPLGQILGAPADPAPPSGPAGGPDQSHTDVADTTFASSSIKLFGHPPQ